MSDMFLTLNRCVNAIKALKNSLFLQLEPKHGPKAAAEYPEIVHAMKVVAEAEADRALYAEMVRTYAALKSGNWVITKIEPCSWLTDEANKENAWSVRRAQAPFCGQDGLLGWNGPTVTDALNKAERSLLNGLTLEETQRIGQSE